MSIRIIRKALSLLIVDIVIIIGIFVLQFRTDSSIIEKIGNLQFTFSQSEDDDKNLLVQNKARISYNGLNFYFDDQTPALIRTGGTEVTPVKLVSWQKEDDLSYVLNFTNDVKVTFELASTEANASLAIVADLPSSVSDFAIPYNFSSYMSIQKVDGDKIILNGKKSTWEASAFSLSSGYFALDKKAYVATYALYNENQKFTFDSIVDLEIANQVVFEQTISNFKDNLISSYKSNSSESNISEQVIVSYIAAQAEKGLYSQAIDEIPSSLKKSRQRTYLSAPYLNTLEEMNTQLDAAVSDYTKKISDSAKTASLDIFTVRNISNFMCVHPKSADVIKLLQSAAGQVQNASVAQATGILEVYDDLVTLRPAYAAYLVPALESCIERITAACAFEGNVLTISENDTFLSVIQAVETGVAVLRYGLISDNVTLQKAGYVLVNSYLADSSSYDLRTLSNIYPIIAYNNKFYPHFEKIQTNDSNELWAWTCAQGISYQKDSDDSITLTIDFPEGYTHYLIVKGVPAFTSIYIYNMAFRTDPRFETYNSSGYIYKTQSGALLLKSRHKTRYETVRLEYHQRSTASSASSKTSKSETESQTQEQTEASSTASSAASSIPVSESTAQPSPASEQTSTPASQNGTEISTGDQQVSSDVNETTSEATGGESQVQATSESSESEEASKEKSNRSNWRRKSSSD